MIMQDKIIEYIRQNRDIYARTEITEQLMKTGYDEADIEAAFKQLDEQKDKRDSVVIDEPPRKFFKAQGAFDHLTSISKRKNGAQTWWDSTPLGFLIFFIGTP